MYNEEVLISIKDIFMHYRMPTERIDNIKEFAVKLLKRKVQYKDYWVLKGINLEVKRGESLGLIGTNGAGKSTLLRIIAGIMDGTSGSVTTKGNIVPLLKLGAGFDQNATGRENIFLNGAIMGYTKKEMQQKYDSIVEFAELKEFMDTPLKNYSSGMLARLGFAIAVDISPDIVLVDEVLAVGDASFQKKCANRIAELQKSGATFIVVSHNNAKIIELCQKTAWLKDGKIHMYGDSRTVCTAYNNFISQKT